MHRGGYQPVTANKPAYALILAMHARDIAERDDPAGHRVRSPKSSGRRDDRLAVLALIRGDAQPVDPTITQ